MTGNEEEEEAAIGAAAAVVGLLVFKISNWTNIIAVGLRIEW